MHNYSGFSNESEYLKLRNEFTDFSVSITWHFVIIIDNALPPLPRNPSPIPVGENRAYAVGSRALGNQNFWSWTKVWFSSSLCRMVDIENWERICRSSSKTWNSLVSQNEFFCSVSPINTRLFCSCFCLWLFRFEFHTLSPFRWKIRKIYRKFG